MSDTVPVVVPDIGDFDQVDVVEVLVAVGDDVSVDQSLITLESDKASMEVPSPAAGRVVEIAVELGGQVGEGDLILTIEAADPPAEEEEEAAGPSEEPVSTSAEAAAPVPSPAPRPSPSRRRPPPPAGGGPATSTSPPHASPAVRRFARLLGADLTRVSGSGARGRILREDVEAFVKEVMTGRERAAGAAIPPVPEIDFSKFGPVESKPLSRIRKLSAANLHRSWLNVPHVTQHDEADITDLEAFRRAHLDEARERGVRLTLLAFLMKAVAASLAEFPEMNSSLAPDGESLILKRYFHLGVAVDTPDGLVVPVVRDVDRKSVYELAGELGEVSGRARERKLRPADIQGASFTISSLGGIGGTAFTPIVNAPEVGILGVSRAVRRPVYIGAGLAPRLMLPVSLSYDHRVIDGASAVRFTTHLCSALADIRRVVL
ncbi:MAG: dihydrolipoyllysine-residue acetyltransferase [Holophagales bacterium]|nr:dihydrolipoyllysine-residue acetyltransferase [Holophagales bacterium]MYG31708.1 dihydrolipoyllysine-residue acetyltransferase [Holophagales bacterium]MYI79550.1 dihydrolipoyllysine-residue acetyltransferase [Holophagales bacterium]